MAATAVELGRGLKDILSTRDKELSVFEQVQKEQEVSQFSGPLLQRDPVSSHGLYEGYREAFVLAAEEFKQVSDCLEKVRGLVKRRRDTSNSKSQTAAAPHHAAQQSRWSQQLTSPPSSCLLSASLSTAVVSGSHSFKSKKHKGAGLGGSSSSSSVSAVDIWHHDASSILPQQMEVAALIDKDSEPQLWILAAVLGYKPQPRPRYTVVDLDPGDEGGGAGGGGGAGAEGRPPPKQYQLEPRKVIPLPSLRDVPMNRRREFGRGSSVLALFPVAGVTTFYKAEVVAGPRKRKDDKYTLQFEDDEEEVDGREVSAQYIAPYPGVWKEDGWE